MTHAAPGNVSVRNVRCPRWNEASCYKDSGSEVLIVYSGRQHSDTQQQPQQQHKPQTQQQWSGFTNNTSLVMAASVTPYTHPTPYTQPNSPT
ncbi:hypothetical protein E2C01_046915 [Portunus trituberculatus]|uniref:Uncharacterized protein n=1 Tax=Portunus trituberculatus TaxID=210409 RepID=A0A5B7FZT3_PORTR|nr:hypothetical protein [Portunus trituberculatus]